MKKIKCNKCDGCGEMPILEIGDRFLINNRDPDFSNILLLVRADTSVNEDNEWAYTFIDSEGGEWLAGTDLIGESNSFNLSKEKYLGNIGDLFAITEENKNEN